jgi:hypothetical protein
MIYLNALFIDSLHNTSRAAGGDLAHKISETASATRRVSVSRSGKYNTVMFNSFRNCSVSLVSV